MMSISSKIGRVVIYFLKLYSTTSDDLVEHVSKCILDAEITHVNGDIIRPVWHELQFLKTEVQR